MTMIHDLALPARAADAEVSSRTPRHPVDAGAAFPLLAQPTYGWTRDGVTPYRPTTREILREWLDAIDLRKGISRLVPLATSLFYVGALGATVAWLVRGPSLASALFVVAAVFVISTVHNTVWFHRYCSHKAYRFKHPLARLAFLWTNPIFFREETYALPHHVHHAHSDEIGDPYGPHLGWLGNFIAFETMQKMNTGIPAWRYEAIVKLLLHVGMPMNSYEDFKRTGSVEPIGHFLARATAAQVMYSTVAYSIGGVELVLAWFAAVFAYLTLLRDFNWRGHGGRAREAGRGRSLARNQWFYGLLGSEWHDNHHRFPRSARSGMEPGQIDLAFALIRLLRGLGVVAAYHDDRARYISGKPSV